MNYQKVDSSLGRYPLLFWSPSFSGLLLDPAHHVPPELVVSDSTLSWCWEPTGIPGVSILFLTRELGFTVPSTEVVQNQPPSPNLVREPAGHMGCRMAPLQRECVYALRAPVLPSLLLWIDMGGDVAVCRFVYCESYVPSGGIHKRDDRIRVVCITKKNEFSQTSESGSLRFFVFAFEVQLRRRLANDVA